MNIKRLGAIDIGANSVKLLICDLINHNNRVVSKKFAHTRIPLKLGDDTFQSGCIGQEKKEKLAQTIQIFKSFIEISSAESYRICATSALREASNKDEIIDFVYSLTGATIEVINHQEEANFLFLGGIQKDYNPETLYIIIDVDGGCTEIALVWWNTLIESESFNLGTIRNLSQDQEREEWNRLTNWLIEKRQNRQNICLIGSGSNINKIKSQFKRGKIRRADLKSYYRNLANMDEEERILKSNLNLNRMEVILPAISIYVNIMKILKVEIIQIPMIGIADGIIKEMYLNKYMLLDD